MSRTSYADWPVIYPCNKDTIEAKAPEVVAAITRLAQAALWGLSGRRYGLAVTTEELYRAPCTAACWTPYKGPDGRWRNSGGYPHDCCGITLARTPVREILAVRIAGTEQAASGYTLEGDTLKRLGVCWPCVDDCDPAAIEVDYGWGIQPGDDAAVALGEMVCDGLKGFDGGTCKMPSRLISTARQGVTQQFESVVEFYKLGKTGLALTDAWLRTVNPSALPFQSRVFSPDVASRVG